MAEAREEFNKWRAEVELLLERLAESAQGELGAELRELRTTLETADYRDLPRALAKMTALAPFIPVLKQYLPSIQTVERWMEAERARRLEIIRKYASAAGEGKVVTKYMRYSPLDPATYEFFELLEVVAPGALPILQREIEGVYAFDYRTRASIIVVGKEEFLKKYKGKRLMAVVHVASAGEEYFIEELRSIGELFEHARGENA
jgi:hypothetical protein